MPEVVDEDVVLFVGTTTLAPGELELQSFKDRLFGRRIEDVQEDWKRMSAQITKIVDATSSARPSGFELDSIEFSLGFSASGQLAFIAEAGVEASVSISLSRSKTAA